MGMMTLGGLILLSVVVSVPATGQWLTHPTSGIRELAGVASRDAVLARRRDKSWGRCVHHAGAVTFSSAISRVTSRKAIEQQVRTGVPRRTSSIG
jgi:hypothetical protein